jgi:hypothetical protein
LLEFANVDFFDVRSANAPAAMYFVISVFPISMTSGAVFAASVASNFCRWSGQFWYWTVTSQPGWLLLNCALAAATASGQPERASTCNQTVRLFAARLVGAEPAAPAVIAATASAPTTSATQMVRLFMIAPRTVLDGSFHPGSTWPSGASGRPTLV